jgi:cysteine desulfurase
MDALAASLTPDTALVSIQWANNETGVIQPVETIASLCRERGVLFHCDAVQVIGKEPVGSSLPCDLLSFSPHKFHGPKGVGVLWTRPGVKLRPTLLGTQELGRRGGTENVPGIIGAGVAAREAAEWLADPAARSAIGALRDHFENLILKAVPDAVINGQGAPRLWNTTNIGFPRLEAEALLLLLSERGLCASAGAACSSGSLDPSPVLLAMGVPEPIAHGSLRFSLSKHTTREEIDQAARTVIESVTRLRASLPG